MEFRPRAVEGVGVNPEFWHGKRVFLTGHTGFKGSWLALWLQRLGATVTGYALAPPTEPGLFEIAHLGGSVIDVRGDVRDLAALQTALASSSPDIVIHMAAQALVRPGYTQPVETYATNVMGTVHLLEAVRQVKGVRAVVVVTSDKCYENREWVWGYREGEPFGGHDPYSNSKGCAELVSAAYRSSFFQSDVALATARAGNVIGGGDWAQDRLIPDMMRAAMEGRRLRLRNPGAIRPWQHVLEPLSGYMALAERLYNGERSFADGWNFGPVDEDAKPVEWIAREVASLWSGLEWEKDKGPHPHEAHYLKLDCSKARAQLRWSPRLSLADALAWTTQWYKAYQDGADMRCFTEHQIDQYTNLMKAAE